jgi:sulfur transfer complex TusBCD TusB component (DsrH family)
MGVIFYSLESDFAKRDLGNAPESVKIVNYEELVKILIENGRNTINL